MNPEPKEISDNVESDGQTVKLRLRYPYLAEETKAAKRINAYISRVFSAICRTAKKSRRYSFFSCGFSAYTSADGYFSVFFELTAKGKDKAYSYSPFSFTFDKNGFAVPLYAKLPKDAFKKAKREFSARGITLTVKEFLYSYYLTPCGAVIYAVRKRASGRHGYIEYEYKAELKEPEKLLGSSNAP